MVDAVFIKAKLTSTNSRVTIDQITVRYTFLYMSNAEKTSNHDYDYKRDPKWRQDPYP